MKELGLFGAVIPEEYGGLELDVASYALVIEEICRGWMSLSGILNSHLIMAYMVATHGTAEQKEHFLPLMATGEKRGGICITEPNAGSDVQAIETKAVRDGDEYVVSGSKSLITKRPSRQHLRTRHQDGPGSRPAEARHQHLHRRERPRLQCRPGHTQAGLQGRGPPVSCPSTTTGCRAETSWAAREGKGFYQIMSGLELGRINVAAPVPGCCPRRA